MCIGFSGMEVTGSFGQPHQLSCDGVGERVREVRADNCFKYLTVKRRGMKSQYLARKKE